MVAHSSVVNLITMTESAEQIGGVGIRDRIDYLKCSASPAAEGQIPQALRLA